MQHLLLFIYLMIHLILIIIITQSYFYLNLLNIYIVYLLKDLLVLYLNYLTTLILFFFKNFIVSIVGLINMLLFHNFLVEEIYLNLHEIILMQFSCLKYHLSLHCLLIVHYIIVRI